MDSNRTEPRFSEKFARRAERVAELIKEELVSGSLRSPSPGEREPLFVARAIAPVVRGVLDRLGIPGLVCGGEGLAPVPLVYFLGVQYRPDVAVMSYNDRVFAMEVKFLRGPRFSAQAALAIGQAELYRVGGFVTTCALIVDVDHSLSANDAAHATSLFGPQHGTHLVLLRENRGRLTL